MVPETSEVVGERNAQTSTQIKDVDQLIDQKLKTFKLETDKKLKKIRIP